MNCCSAIGKVPMMRSMVFDGVGGVQRGHDEVSGFGGFQRDLDGLAVAHSPTR